MRKQLHLSKTQRLNNEIIIFSVHSLKLARDYLLEAPFFVNRIFGK